MKIHFNLVFELLLEHLVLNKEVDVERVPRGSFGAEMTFFHNVIQHKMMITDNLEFPVQIDQLNNKDEEEENLKEIL